MSELPTMFIGSSVEGLKVAQALQTELQYDVEAKIWSQGVFGLSEGTLESLARRIDDFDFAVLVLTADDVVIKRDVQGLAARDNVLFEAGLFMGALGRDRTYLVASAEDKLEFPSDLAGVSIGRYRQHRDGNLRAALGPVAHEIRQAMSRAARRRRRTEDSEDFYRSGWGQLREAMLDAALYVNDWNLYVHNPDFARAEIRDAIEAKSVIPSRFHYSSEAMARMWVRRCKDRTYKHQRNTVNFWMSRVGQSFASSIAASVGEEEFDYVSLGPGDGEKDAALLRTWLRNGRDVIYYPYDSSYPLTVEAVRRVAGSLERQDGLRVKAILADFFDLEKVRAVFAHRSAPNVIGLLGNLGNLNSELTFLGKLRDVMGERDLLLLEIRLQSAAKIEQLSTGSSMRHDFGPLAEYFGLEFPEEAVTASWADDISDIPQTRTMLITYRGPVPKLGEHDVKLQYIHLYHPDEFLTVVDHEGFEVLQQHVATDADPPFLECVLRRRR